MKINILTYVIFNLHKLIHLTYVEIQEILRIVDDYSAEQAASVVLRVLLANPYVFHARARFEDIHGDPNKQQNCCNKLSTKVTIFS